MDIVREETNRFRKKREKEDRRKKKGDKGRKKKGGKVDRQKIKELAEEDRNKL